MAASDTALFDFLQRDTWDPERLIAVLGGHDPDKFHCDKETHKQFRGNDKPTFFLIIYHRHRENTVIAV